MHLRGIFVARCHPVRLLPSARDRLPRRGCDQIMHRGHTRRPRKAGPGAGGLRIIGDWALEAHNAEKNHHRRYQVTVGRDLLDDWTVAIRYGRTGQAGRELRYAATAAD